jgi:RNA polymerase sigma-70 factor, ECF subfamily
MEKTGNTGDPALDDKAEKLSEDGIILAAIHDMLNGNKDAFKTIVIRYAPILYSPCYRMLGQRIEAEEALQEIFLKTFRSIRRFELSKRFYPWIYSIAVNTLRSLLKRRSRPSVLFNTVEFNDSPEPPNHVKNPGKDPLREIVDGEAEELARKALLELREDHRMVFVLREMERLSVAETANAMKISEGTVKTFLFRAKKSLIERILKDETDRVGNGIILKEKRNGLQGV